VARHVIEPFRAVVFDLFGTLVPEFGRADFFQAVDEMGAALGLSPDAFRTAWEGSAVERQTGVYPDVEANVRAICAALGTVPAPDVLARALDVRAAMYRRGFHPRAGAEETLRALKERGYPIALISMCAPDTPPMWRASVLAPFVDVEVFSSEVGLRKPDAAIYERACAELGVAPRDCLYCGDGAYGELTGAQAVGMTPYLIRDPDEEPDRLRFEGEDWRGAAVSDLRDLLDLLPGI
jgi:putative hydrolase of the HAD superfamily